jgi:TatD DNase family protein
VVLFDVHAHLTHQRLAPILEEVLSRASAAGVSTIISNGLNPEDNQHVLELSRAHPIVKPAFGYYPVDAVLTQMRAAGHDYPDQRTAWQPDEAVAWVEAHAEAAFAIGEIGLDGYWVPEQFWAAQEEVFVRLVRLAMSVDKPIIIHTRKREARAFELLCELGATRVNWHCFGGRVSLARRIAAAGHYLSIPANARKNQAFTGMLQTLPRTQLLLETDCPYLGPERDQTNEPANVSVTSRYAAELWGVGEAEVELQLAENFERLFGSPP